MLTQQAINDTLETEIKPLLANYILLLYFPTIALLNKKEDIDQLSREQSNKDNYLFLQVFISLNIASAMLYLLYRDSLQLSPSKVIIGIILLELLLAIKMTPTIATLIKMMQGEIGHPKHIAHRIANEALFKTTQHSDPFDHQPLKFKNTLLTNAYNMAKMDFNNNKASLHPLFMNVRENLPSVEDFMESLLKKFPSEQSKKNQKKIIENCITNYLLKSNPTNTDPEACGKNDGLYSHSLLAHALIPTKSTLIADENLKEMIIESNLVDDSATKANIKRDTVIRDVRFQKPCKEISIAIDENNFELLYGAISNCVSTLYALPNNKIENQASDTNKLKIT